MILSRAVVFAFFLSLVGSPVFAALTFTGEVSLDFADVPNCYDDPGGKEVAMPSGVTTSGLDIDRVCFFYDGFEDKLYIGVEAVDSAIFGDVDGNGNPATSALSGFSDYANLGSTETFVISMDLDGDSQAGGFGVATVDVLVGVSDTGSLANLGVYEPSVGYDPDNPGNGFGTRLPTIVTLSASPAETWRDLEFVIDDFSLLTGELSNPAPPIPLQIFSHSVAGGVGSDFAPATGMSFQYPLYDFDRDQIMDWEELEAGTDPVDADTDDDGILDGVELAAENPTDPLDVDTDGDTLADGQEDSDQNGAVDAGETDPNDTDSDADGLLDSTELNGTNPTNPVVADTDGDGLMDGEEDVNFNGSLDVGETNPNIPDTDAGGVNDKIEIDNGFDPLDPTDDSQAGQVTSQTGAPLMYDQVQGGGISCALLRSQTAGTSHSVSLGLFVATILLLWKWRSRIS